MKYILGIRARDRSKIAACEGGATWKRESAKRQKK